MSLLTYKDTRPWSKATKNSVVSRKMPPWFADPQYSHFRNDRTLAQEDIDTIVNWTDSGAPQSDAKDAPAPVQWLEKGWQIKPDIIIDLPEFKVPAKGAWNGPTSPFPDLSKRTRGLRRWRFFPIIPRSSITLESCSARTRPTLFITSRNLPLFRATRAGARSRAAEAIHRVPSVPSPEARTSGPAGRNLYY
jgi:hypothetical protein